MTSKTIKQSRIKLPMDKLVFAGRYHPVVFRKKMTSFLFMLFRYALLISLGFVILTPLLTTLRQALTAHSSLGMKNAIWVPPAISLVSFDLALQILEYSQGLAYTLLNTGVLAFLQTFCAALAAYSFSRLKFKGSGVLFGLVLFTIVVPAQSIMLSQYMNFRNFDIFGMIRAVTGSPLNMLGSPASSYILAGLGMGVKGGLFVYILRQAYRQLPISIEEAAYVDGAGFIKTFLRIVIPGISSALTTVSVLSFVWNYADTYYVSLLNPTDMHLPLRMLSMQGNMAKAINDVVLKMPRFSVQNNSPMVQTAAASACALLVILPLLLIYLFIQKRFVQGVERSGLGGD